jgi:hypothetical protein
MNYVIKDAEKRRKERQRERGEGMRQTTLETHLRKKGLALAPQPMP